MRPTAHTLVAALTITAALAVVTRTDAKPPTLQTRTAQVIVAAWNCQDKLPADRSPAYSPWKPHTQKFRRAQLNLWTNRLNRCRAALARSIPNTQNWLTAVSLAQRAYPGTADWLLKISRREGGWGRFVMNSQGSGCGGWMQFMSSTYWAYSHSAYNDLARRGWRIDPRSNSWTDPLGQAVTAAYMRYTGQDRPHWTATSY